VQRGRVATILVWIALISTAWWMRDSDWLTWSGARAERST